MFLHLLEQESTVWAAHPVEIRQHNNPRKQLALLGRVAMGYTPPLRMRRVPNSEEDVVMRAIVHAMHPLQARVHTLTWDNGSEFAEYAVIDIARQR